MLHRFATKQDFDPVYDLYMNEVSNPYLTYDSMGKNDFEIIYQDLLKTNTLFVSENATKVVGTYRLIPKTDRQAHTLYLGGFAVKASAKGKGVGTEMLSGIQQKAIEESKKRIELTVSPENIAAVHLYKKCGFKIEGTIRMSYKLSSTGKYYDEYLMAWIDE